MKTKFMQEFSDSHHAFTNSEFWNFPNLVLFIFEPTLSKDKKFGIRATLTWTAQTFVWNFEAQLIKYVYSKNSDGILIQILEELRSEKPDDLRILLQFFKISGAICFP